MSAASPLAPAATPHRPGARALALLVLLLAIALRLWPWGTVFSPWGVVLLADSDPHYHVLRAERMLQGAPGAPWRDPAMNWPIGTELLWPPLFDALIAGGAWLTSGVDATRDEIAAVAAVVPVVFGLLTVLLVAALGRRLLGRRRGWIAAFLVATLPAAATFSTLGRADQHAAELFLFAAILLAFARVLEGERGARTGEALLAVLVAAAFWTWQGSAVLLGVPLVFAALSHVLGAVADPFAARAGRAVAVAGGGGALLLAVTLAAFGPPGALLRPATAGVNGLHVAIAAGTGLAGALLLAVRRVDRGRGLAGRAVHAALALALPAVVLLGLSPALREGAGGGLAALLRGNPWYGNIDEFRPPLLDGNTPFLGDLVRFLVACGLVVPAAMAALHWARRRWRREEGRAVTLLLATAFLCWLVAALARRRFEGYLVVAAAVPAEAGIRASAAWLARRACAIRGARRPVLVAMALFVAAPLLRYAPGSLAPLTQRCATAMETFAQLRDLPPPPGREAVLSPWTLGHLVQYYWGRPVVVSPFGTDGGVGAFDAWAAFFFAPDAGSAEAAAAARRVGWIVVDNPANAADELLGFAPPGTPPAFTVERSLWNGAVRVDTPAFWSLVPARLYFGDGRGGGPGGVPALTGFRLLLESPPTSPEDPTAEEQLKVFGVVAGARVTVSGASPGGTVEASVKLRTNLGRDLLFSTTSRAGDDGRATLRLPYATGSNGGVRAGTWLVTNGVALATLTVAEDEVLLGGVKELALPPRAGAAGDAPATAGRGPSSPGSRGL